MLKNYFKEKNQCFKIYIIIFSLIFTNLPAEILKKLNVSGNERISEETIKVYGDITIGKDYSAFDTNEIIKKLYSTNFFEDIKVSLKNGILDIAVKEYAIINNIELRGEKSNTVGSKVLEQLQLKAKESFIENKLVEDINLIKKIMDH